jgi:hypothetical protein
MLRSLALAFAFSFCLVLAEAAAQPEASEQADIVVTGVRPDQVQTFVEQVSAVPPSVDQIARWNDDICVRIAGLGAEQGQHVVDRVSERAAAVGLSAGGAGCDPNVFVFFAADADTFAHRLVEERRPLFAYYQEQHVVTLGRDALTDFTETSRPVRWWHVTQIRGADGARLGSDQAGNSSPPPPSEMRYAADGLTGLQAVRSNGSRTRAAERQDFNRVIVIVDGARAGEYPVDSIADYIAMVTLAQIDPRAQTRDYPTILNLFEDNPADASFEMTNWDRAYLDGLYRTTRNAASATQQVREISRRMQGGG